MIKSMTGFGRASAEAGDKKITVEIRSVNSKALDLSLRLPVALREKESEIKNMASSLVQRGKTDINLSCEGLKEQTSASINRNIAKIYYKQLKQLSKELNADQHNILALVLKMPDVIKTTKEDPAPLNAKEWSGIQEALNAALGSFDKFRRSEGRVLEEDLKKRIRLILGLLASIETLDKKRIQSVKGKLRNSLLEKIPVDKIDENRLEQELIFYFEKLDITEEKLRLKAHCDYFLLTTKEDACGRKLGFISQEIGREINTIGSKANNSDIQKYVVQMKDELEKVKEQLLNVL